MPNHTPNEVQKLNDSGPFDQDWYLAHYPDVSASGMPAHLHYEQIGRLLGRHPRSSPNNEQTPKCNDCGLSANILPRYDFLFVDGTEGSGSTPYRVDRVSEGLNLSGFTTHRINGNEVQNFIDSQIIPRNVVFFRAPYWGAYVELSKKVKDAGGLVIYDIDDLVFDTSILEYIDGYKHLPENEKENFVNGICAYREFIINASYCTSPTSFLAEEMRRLGKAAYVVRNSISKDNINFYKNFNFKRKKPGDVFVIGYYSGSKTHQKDFSIIAKPLIGFMSRNPTVVFRPVGLLDLEPWPELCEWQHAGHGMTRVTPVCKMPHDMMIRDQLTCDLVVAPLEVGNPFCEAKSELKFFEASLLGIPVIASHTQTFYEASMGGKLAYLAESEEDWALHFDSIFNNYSDALEKAEKARVHATNHYSIEKISKDFLKSYSDFREEMGESECSLFFAGKPIRSRRDASLKISFIIPGLIIGGGGHRNILRTAYFLQNFGHKISLYFTSTQESPDEIKGKIIKHFYPLECHISLFSGVIDQCDVLFATHWSTVKAAVSVKSKALEIIYFVQDYEPLFERMGSTFVEIENTYRLGLYHITSGPWCENFLRRDFNAEADHFVFPIDKKIYSPRIRTKKNKNVVFFAKPEMPRRCFELGMAALTELNRIAPEVEIILFGSSNLDDSMIDVPAKIRGVLPSLDDLAVMYSNADIGLVFSTTNPSLIPYEMMASGLAVVDLNRGDNYLNYGGRYDIAYLADPEPRKMASQILILLENQSELGMRRKNGIEFTNQFPNEYEMCRKIESLIFSRLAY
jgi:glycosyltransferase involved in cell wall biosynthesis